MKPQKTYTQIGYFLIISIIVGFLILIASFIFAEPEKPNERWLFLLSAFLLALPMLAFYKLDVIIDDYKVTLIMGIGIFKKEFNLNEIISCVPVKNSIFYGIGIRRIPHGWLYNVNGRKAIELTFKDRKNKIRIGADRPDEVCRDIIDRLNRIAERNRG
jgi:hypothetical protein